MRKVREKILRTAFGCELFAKMHDSRMSMYVPLKHIVSGELKFTILEFRQTISDMFTAFSHKKLWSPTLQMNPKCILSLL